jgi:hypothetical protein
MNNNKIKFIDKSIEVHKNFYDYSRFVYVNAHAPGEIICPVHGSFFQKPYVHKNGSGCPKCGNKRTGLSKFKTNEQYIEDCVGKMGDLYDYSKTNYKSVKDDIEVICRKHGSFFVNAGSHYMWGKGCRECVLEKQREISKGQRYTTEDFKNNGSIKHNNFYDYTKTVYVHCNEKVIITCPLHGDFLQIPAAHLQGSGCYVCGLGKSSKLTTPEFIERARKKHKDRYDYSKTVYTGALDDVIIICKIHGEFNQKASNHLLGHGCSACGRIMSHSEVEIVDFLKEQNIVVEQHVKSIISPKELDIYVPTHNLAIEYDGVYWHSETTGGKDRNYHLSKTTECEKSNISLLHIFDYEWENSSDIVKSIICSKLGIYTDKIYARKCTINENLSSKKYREFCSVNHIQGYISSSIRYGLEYDGELVAVMGFRKNKKYSWEMARYCSKLNSCIVGGMSKLFNRFLCDHSPDKCVSYADKRYFTGSTYSNLGFVLSHTSEPNYFYFQPKSNYPDLKSRINYQKHKLKNKLTIFDNSLSEWENMKNNGFDRIWDCGNNVWIYEDRN